MKVILCHNWYRSSLPSGENIVVQSDFDLVSSVGIEICPFFKYSDDILKLSRMKKLVYTLSRISGVTNIHIRKEFQQLLNKEKNCQIFHAHNILPMLSFDIFRTAKQNGLFTIQTLHNYRMLATTWHLLDRTGARRPSGVAENSHHRNMLTRLNRNRIVEYFYTKEYSTYWKLSPPFSYIDCFICLTEFQQNLLVSSGIDKARTVVKPNSVVDYGFVNSNDSRQYCVFIGRLSEEKGIHQLCNFWHDHFPQLIVIGDGPLRNSLPVKENILYFGIADKLKVMDLLRGAICLIMNSDWYEGLPLVIAEAFSVGTPCLVPNFGPFPNSVQEGRTGYLFSRNDEKSFSQSLNKIVANYKEMRVSCRSEYEKKYTAEANIRSLKAIYMNLIRGLPPGAASD